MTRRRRHSSARATCWVEKYTGKNIINGYSRWFAVDLLSAVTELRVPGVPISHEREKQIGNTIATRATARKHRRKSGVETKINETRSDSDNTFAHIAGYPPGGVPYGTTWEEFGEEPPSFDDE